jgi:hypothetical protein
MAVVVLLHTAKSGAVVNLGDGKPKAGVAATYGLARWAIR